MADTPEGVHETPLRTMPNAREAIGALRQDFAFGIVTNTRSARRADVEGHLDALGLLADFPVIVTSLDARIRKPDPQIYRLALAEAKCPPEAACMVGNDALCDVAGAREAGLRSVYYDPHGRGPALDPDATITDLAQLPAIAIAWRRGLASR